MEGVISRNKIKKTTKLNKIHKQDQKHKTKKNTINFLRESVPVSRAICLLVKYQQNAEQVNIEEVVTL
jgi:hypothetical protein